MAAKVSPLRIPTPGVFLGTFHIKKFNISHNEDRIKYESLRTKSNMRGSGITIENIHDLTETTEVREEDGSSVRTDQWFIVVSWWDKEDRETDPPEGSFHK